MSTNAYFTALYLRLLVEIACGVYCNWCERHTLKREYAVEIAMATELVGVSLIIRSNGFRLALHLDFPSLRVSAAASCFFARPRTLCGYASIRAFCNAGR